MKIVILHRPNRGEWKSTSWKPFDQIKGQNRPKSAKCNRKEPFRGTWIEKVRKHSQLENSKIESNGASGLTLLDFLAESL
jgi:hypothetical protein